VIPPDAQEPLTHLEAAAGLLDARLPELCETDDAAMLCRLVGLIERQRQRIQQAEASLASAAARAMRTKELEAPGVHAVRYRTSTRKEWRHDDLAKAVVEAHMEQSGGDMDPWAVRDALMACAGISYWRKGALEERGIEVGDYCTTETGRMTVRVTLTEET
jgi:hypothetical protein